MAKDVKSENQSGGITAETVNVSTAGDIGGVRPPPKRGLHWLVRASAIAGIIATVILVLQFLT